ncbi:ArnT family glycosyltransferase [Burkholderia thailandensis]|uniref:Membrane protein n=1 Tax=Burkholderia thailandensis TaxID=57975 RepID=A0AAW9D6T4_BURTH|nr:UDP phosphate-alpha-4-amino-4-deoxy-L-arabinose arabinosyl transferase [Burkholderia thailandensis]AHI64902.1 putative membrane protein [Burkholderia thailandensis H0587]AIP63774.1 UDP phosphate-alpha-4-amino-4-deoxy-L-arabinose arabinosyl transferase [Burkholderia thailandensis]AJY28141.1 putative membrane protein [Burkholderia thailandensis 34]AOI51782.1 UDP phosphate-alpha-4-amino-4-deoxy-L-arabinose arabinosyl transferase [Burkholderia thailandensis]AOJ50789.1 UDP phosphate-alpha-4-amin
MKPVVRLTASATRALPRWLLLTLCIVYAAFGLFGRDPWKNEDAAGFGVMWTMAQGGLHDWLLPNLVGKFVTSDGPLGYWLGSLAIRALPWVDASNASRVYTGVLFCVASAFVWYATYLLGRRAEIQPFKYAFGGEPEPRDYGRTLADGALLILLACFGLAERGHETTPQLAQFAWIAMFVYGLVRAIDKPAQGALWWGLALGLVALSGNPVLVAALAVGTLALYLATPEIRCVHVPAIGLPLAVGVFAIWPLAAHVAFPDDASWFLNQWLHDSLMRFSGPPTTVLAYAAKNLPLFTWPAWPLAIWAWVSWAGLRRRPHIAIPLSVVVPLLVLVILQSQQTNRMYMLLLPALAVVATFALPTLKRGAINAIDWFAVLSFTILGTFVWLVWLASLTGFPHPLARNLGRLVPGYEPHFKVLSFVCALAATACWLMLVRWRISRQPKVLWRSVVLSSAGTTLMWVLLMTLWLPIVNYSRTYRDVAQQIAAHLPSDYECISPVRLGDAQIATFAYFGDMHFSFTDDCDVILRQDRADFGEPSSISQYVWRLVWEGRRVADRDERFRLYERIERPKAPIKRRPPRKAR